MKVLLAVDGSDYTRRALDYLASHAWLRSGNQLTAFTVVLPVPHRAAAFVPSQVVQNYYRDDAEQVLRPVRERLAGADAEVDSDWVDTSILTRFADLLTRRKTGRRFTYIDLGGQSCLIGGATPEGRDTLRAKTGLAVDWLT